MNPRIIQRNETKVIGLEIRTSNEIEAQPAQSRIPEAWKKFDEMKDGIPDRTNTHFAFGLYSDYESDNKGLYSLAACSEVRALDRVPKGMVGKIIPPGRYLVFTAKGEMPRAIMSTWEGIWKYFSNGTSYKRTFTADFEVYDKQRPDDAEIYIAIK